MKELRYLDLRGCPGFTDGGLATLAASGSLSRIVLDGCDGITEQGVDELRSRMPGAVVTKDDDAWSYLQRP